MKRLLAALVCLATSASVPFTSLVSAQGYSTATVLDLTLSGVGNAAHATSGKGVPTQWNTPGAGNPIVPGYFADPTIRKFGDTFYIYATTDGTGNGYGPAQVWVSKDFVNWQNALLNWPTTEVVWAPDVVRQPDGTFRYYYCTPCMVHVGESSSPLGPWTNRLGSPDAVLVPDRFVHNAITLDPMLFRDDDGSEYLYFGTWGIYENFGCGVAKLADDGKSFTDKKLIPNTEITDFFEAPYVFKRNGVYYFTYSSGSCHDGTYRVQYATSTESAMGPYTYRGCILKTNADGTIHGPGHHSILIDGDDYYIVYHRHNNPHSVHGFHRQVCIDPLDFDAQGNILPVRASHEGVVPKSFAKQAKRYEGKNLAYGKSVTASSAYSEWFKPEYAVDDNNGTLWRAASCHGEAWLQIDFGKTTKFNQVFTQFEYATFFYQYRLETSSDGQTWRLYADRTANRYAGSPMVDLGEAEARYLRLTITDTQHNGHFPAVWNMKVYQATGKFNPFRALPNPRVDEEALLAGYPRIHEKDLEDDPAESLSPLIDLDVSRYSLGTKADGIPVVQKAGKAAFHFSGKSMELDGTPLRTLVYNAPYTVTAWVLNPEASGLETVCQLMPTEADLATVQLRSSRDPSGGIVGHNASMENAGAPQALREGQWQHWAVSFDGFMERVYCDGQEVSAKNIFLMLRPGSTVSVGASWQGGDPFTGFLHSLKVYDRAFTPEDVLADMAVPTDLDTSSPQGRETECVLEKEGIHMACEFHSDHLREVTIVGGDGQELGGAYEYQFSFDTDDTATGDAAWTDSPSLLYSDPAETSRGVPAKATRKNAARNRLAARVRDAFGHTITVTETREMPKQVEAEDVTAPILAKADARGRIVLRSKGRQLNSDPSQNGPIEAVEIAGDFIAQCRVADLTGMDRHRTPAYNEGGLLIADTLPDGSQRLIQLGVFPSYECGNMLTLLAGEWRPQYPNRLGWDFEPWLQLERIGGKVWVRTSRDGRVWHEMPQSPVTCDFPADRPVRVGLFQTTYSEAEASFTFDHVSVWRTRRQDSGTHGD